MGRWSKYLASQIHIHPVYLLFFWSISVGVVSFCMPLGSLRFMITSGVCHHAWALSANLCAIRNTGICIKGSKPCN